MRHRLYYHLIWTTRLREPAIDAAVADFLVRFTRAIVARERGRLLEIGIVATHVHLLVTLHPCTTIPRLMQSLKGGSGALINRQRLCPTSSFRWADGYTIHTVSPAALARIRTYVRNQPSHHPDYAITGWRAPDSCHETLREAGEISEAGESRASRRLKPPLGLGR